MREIRQRLSETKIGMYPWEWIPENFNDFVQELDAILSHCREIEHMVLFRGHRERKWLLDSTFARSLKKVVFGIDPWDRLLNDFRLSLQHQQIVLNLFFFKFGTMTFPSEELLTLERTEGIDAWFEWMRRLQQYPEEDKLPLNGTFLIDWTRNSDAAIYFANDRRIGEGAVWICDATATGKTLHRDITVGEILQKMEEQRESNASIGVPLIFHPRKQVAQKRATNQDAVYIAHMDLRIDLSEVWDNLQKQGERIFVKLVLPAGTNEECSQYLIKKGVSKEFLFPD